jgi:hypothetical protein
MYSADKNNNFMKLKLLGYLPILLRFEQWDHYLLLSKRILLKATDGRVVADVRLPEKENQTRRW